VIKPKTLFGLFVNRHCLLSYSFSGRYNILHSFIRKSMTEMPLSGEAMGKIRLSFTKEDQHYSPGFWLIIPNYPIGKY
jgi:hypothetical protein